MKKEHQKVAGYTLLEIIFYIALLAMLSLVIVNSLIAMTKSFRETNILADLQESSNIIERISREIRKANDINSISTSNLELDTTDEDGNATTVEFLLAGTDIQLLEGGVLTGNINSPKISVTALTFTQIDTARGKAVKITLTTRSNNDVLNRTVEYNDTVVLRGDYSS